MKYEGIVMFRSPRGFGWIRRTNSQGKDVFFHVDDALECSPVEGDKVRFNIGSNTRDNSREKATNIELIDAPASNDGGAR